jgi:hypothetical protein
MANTPLEPISSVISQKPFFLCNLSVIVIANLFPPIFFAQDFSGGGLFIGLSDYHCSLKKKSCPLNSSPWLSLLDC